MYQDDISHSLEVKFQNNKVDTVFYPFEIKSYYFDSGQYYTSKVAKTTKDTMKIFAEYLVKGEKDLFYFRTGSGFHYAISISDYEIEEIPYVVKTVNIDGVNYQKESILHIGYLKYYFEDCPQLIEKIEKIEVPDRKSLIAITKDYHDINCGEGKCIIYEKEKQPFKMAVEPIYSYSLKGIVPDVTPLNAFGCHLYFWIPNSSKKMYIKAGLIYSELPTFKYYQIPFQFEYIFPFKTVQPKFDVGVIK